MDDIEIRAAVRLFQDLRKRMVSITYANDRSVREQAELLVKDFNWAITRVFGDQSVHKKDIFGKSLFYARAVPDNQARYFERDRALFLRTIDRILIDLGLNPGIKIETFTSQDMQEPQIKSGDLVVRPLWKGRYDVDANLVFLAMPFSEPWSDGVWDMISNIVSTTGMNCVRADETSGRVVMDDVWELICKAKVIIADLTAKNANVAYEVGLADVLGKPVILLSQTPNVSFDFLGSRLITYDNDFNGAKKLKKELTERLKKYKTT